MHDLAFSIITLTCPTCGAKLTFLDGIQLLVCGSCGNKHMVQRNGVAISLVPQDVRQVRVDPVVAESTVAPMAMEIAALDAKLDELMARSDDEWIDSRPITTSFYIGSFFSSLALLTLITQVWIAVILCGVISLIAWFMTIKLHMERHAKIDALREKEMKQLEMELDVKYQQYQKRRQKNAYR